MAGAIFQDILIFFRPRLDFYRGDFRGLGGESPVATVYFFRWIVVVVVVHKVLSYACKPTFLFYFYWGGGK